MMLEELETVRDIEEYEFSKETLKKMEQIVYSDRFAEMSSAEVLKYLVENLRVIPFGDYLKRYLYLEIRPEMSFREVPDEFYIDLILSGFKESHVPLHKEGVSTTPKRMVSRWLNQTMVSREVIFLLGFGLRMKTETISEFLQKVLQEEDFDFQNPMEVIYWYCYDQQMPYSYALEMLQKYETYPSTPKRMKNMPKWTPVIKKLEYKLAPEKCLERYLKSLKKREPMQSYLNSPAYPVFQTLYQSVCDQIAFVRLQESRQPSAGKKPQAKQMLSDQVPVKKSVKPADVEKELYAGIPRDKDGNLQKASLSALSEIMNCHFLSRQRIEKIRSGKYPIRRYDIIHLCFYLHAEDRGSGVSAKDRFRVFVKETDKYLKKCHMSPLHTSHPLETFLMICILSELPLIMYSDVLEISFSQE